jgi:hypothetical protein
MPCETASGISPFSSGKDQRAAAAARAISERRAFGSLSALALPPTLWGESFMLLLHHPVEL